MLVNKSDDLNNVNIIDTISGFLRALKEASKLGNKSIFVVFFVFWLSSAFSYLPSLLEFQGVSLAIAVLVVWKKENK